MIKTARKTKNTFCIEDDLSQILKDQPIEKYVKDLDQKPPEKKLETIRSLGGLCTFSNYNAFYFLLNYLRSMGILETISQVHEKMEVFRQANHFSDKTELRKYCLSEFTVMDSTRTNRQWVNDLLRFFKENLTEELKLELSLLIKKKKMSATMKRKLREIIEPTEDSFDSLLFVG